MDSTVLARLNRMLRDALGVNPHGGPRFQWMWSTDLHYKVKDGFGWVSHNGILVQEPKYLDIYPVEGQCWVLATWLAPPTETSWLAQFGDTIPYPAKGRYRPTDMQLAPGAEPNENLTYVAIHEAKHNDSTSVYLLGQEAIDAAKRVERNFEKRADDFVHDRWTTFNHVPGKRGAHVSYGGVEGAHR